MWPFRPVRAKPLGRRGERLAARYLRRKGCKILARGYRCPSGEVDIIALVPSGTVHGGEATITFVEVKTRSSDRHVDPESAVDSRKRRQLLRAAKYYLANHDTDDLTARFDVVSIILRRGWKPRIRHIPDAF